MSQWDEGHTLAGWTGFTIATVGATGSGLGLCTGSALGLWGGLGVVLIGVLTTWALHLAGWGKPPGRRPVDEWGWRVRDLGARDGHPGCLGCRLAGRGRPAGVPARVSGEAGRGGTGTGEAVTGSGL
ncbi:HGxxPAAW family protein [Streptomyces sp. 142MFCol3.1]|uniref:HGxxPAAW family protein n=1 Tax=Streptomyces sp. 142MFCol3.1 TaxID=1172179 RepID=UPI0004201731|nr:HGxxPAAW family protein [Streptomyces sp. 142MFCol3.1]